MIPAQNDEGNTGACTDLLGQIILAEGHVAIILPSTNERLIVNIETEVLRSNEFLQSLAAREPAVLPESHPIGNVNINLIGITYP